jgi:hypothetical protein
MSGHHEHSLDTAQIEGVHGARRYPRVRHPVLGA